MTIKVLVEPRKGDGLYEIHVAAGNNEHLLVSHQGYENAGDAEALVRRLWPPATDALKLKRIRELAGAAGFSQLAIELRGMFGELDEAPEPVDLTVKYRDGRGKHEMIR